jgi:hypothetical protein
VQDGVANINIEQLLSMSRSLIWNMKTDSLLVLFKSYLYYSKYHGSITRNSSDLTALNTNLGRDKIVAKMFKNPVGKTLKISFPLYNDFI